MHVLCRIQLLTAIVGAPERRAMHWDAGDEGLGAPRWPPLAGPVASEGDKPVVLSIRVTDPNPSVRKKPFIVESAGTRLVPIPRQFQLNSDIITSVLGYILCFCN